MMDRVIEPGVTENSVESHSAESRKSRLDNYTGVNHQLNKVWKSIRLLDAKIKALRQDFDGIERKANRIAVTESRLNKKTAKEIASVSSRSYRAGQIFHRGNGQ